MTAPINAIGHRYGKLLVVEQAPHIGGRRAYKCLCDCGNYINARIESLRADFTKSCGCIRNERIGNLNKTHGKTNTPEYRSWTGAKERCFNPNSKKYKNYGARGITMCEEWVNNFEAFLAYVGKKPSPKHSIGRIDVNKNYEPGNVRWETMEEQGKSRTDNVIVEINGEKMILKDACRKLNLEYKQTSNALKHKKVTWDQLSNDRKF